MIPAPLTRNLRRVAAMAGAALIGVGLTTAAATPAAAETAVGYVRLAHLSPDTPAVDVYLDDVSGPLKEQEFDGVGYGTVSAYLTVPTGLYAVSMRPAGAPRSTPPVLTTEVTVAEGKAYTVAGVGRYADLGLRVLDDDISAPAPGQAKVRVVQASVRAPVLDIAASGGPTIASNVQFATTTDYRQVAPGQWRLRLQQAAGATTTASVKLAGGTVYSLLVLDAKRGGLTTDLVVDASGGLVTPKDGVNTGGGGTAGRDSVPYPLIATATLLLAGVAAAAALGLRRRARRTW